VTQEKDHDHSIQAQLHVSDIFSTSLFAVEVDVEEIRTRKVEFINYRGPQGRADSVRDINAIGEGWPPERVKANTTRSSAIMKNTPLSGPYQKRSLKNSRPTSSP
jgi:hypothetical protein